MVSDKDSPSETCPSLHQQLSGLIRFQHPVWFTPRACAVNEYVDSIPGSLLEYLVCVSPGEKRD